MICVCLCCESVRLGRPLAMPWLVYNLHGATRGSTRDISLNRMLGIKAS